MNDVQTLTVDQVMTPAPVCLNEDCTLAGALTFLVREHYQAAPIVNDRGELAGMVTRASLLAWLTRLVEDDGATTLESLMSRRIRPAIDREPLRCSAGMNLKAASKLLVREHAPAMLVLRDGRLVGIVTLRDVVRAMAYGDEPCASEARESEDAIAEALRG